MSQTFLNQDFLEDLRRSAREKSRLDKSRTYLQWLDQLCGEFGFTYTSLKKRIEELEALLLAESLAADDQKWEERLARSRVWGSIPERVDQSLPLPVEDGFHAPWPHAFVESRLFSLTEFGPRRALSGPIFRTDGREMFYGGEELRISSDQILLMGLIMASRDVPCGAIVECSLSNLEQVMGSPLSDQGNPMSPTDVERTLWRLSNCHLRFSDYDFDGPILAYSDASKAPDNFLYVFNPAFANFFYPFLRVLGRVLK
ncbi:hypothetical protein [Achromobacter kerstersii]